MKLRQLQEARYHGEHPFIADYFRNFLDPDALSKTRYPKEIEFDTWRKALTSRFGEPQITDGSTPVRHRSILEWEVELPKDVVERYGMNMAFVYLHKHNNLIEVVWE